MTTPNLPAAVQTSAQDVGLPATDPAPAGEGIALILQATVTADARVHIQPAGPQNNGAAVLVVPMRCDGVVPLTLHVEMPLPLSARNAAEHMAARLVRGTKATVAHPLAGQHLVLRQTFDIVLLPAAVLDTAL